MPRLVRHSLVVSLIVHTVIGGAVCLVQSRRDLPSAPIAPVLTVQFVREPEPVATAAPVAEPVPPEPATPTAPQPAPAEPPAQLTELPPPDPLPAKPVIAIAVAETMPIQTSSPTPSLSVPTAPAGPARPGAAVSPEQPARPVYRVNPEPLYLLAARRRKQEGLVLLSVAVDARGHATSVALKTTSGFPLLDEAAAQAVRNWEFEPARLQGAPVESLVDVPVRFQLTR